MKRMPSYIFAVFMAVLLAGSAARAESFRSEGWWVVLAAFKETSVNRDAAEAAARNAAAQCGLEAFNDFSSKFEGFTPGLTVVVVWSAFASKAKANAALERVRPCVPDAYIKRARYLGE